ncbi:Imm50 family immunity protein [Kitasatospora kifunensis]|uniref:Immunity protein 50 of polymorphic toxin system n=1 Tax=Kitasatospora kifunensis TaxID=58351 RepID=A0A7W7VTS2_KITKI|nr:Imm50 family immunity protein [Kitasatospora kifunensis]MBB4921914.1 hypothetical protein [Kitasatospora kifunensis]
MAASDWTDHVAGTSELVRLFQGPPPLADLDLLGLLIDERPDSAVTLGFTTTHVPGAPESPAFEDGMNALEFFLVFSDIRGLEIAGWEHTGLRRYEISQVGAGSLNVSMTGDSSHISFSAGSCRVEGLRAYRAAVDSM